MAKKMMRYLEEQPAVWQSILHGAACGRAAKNWRASSIKRILIVGSGSSCNAGLCAQKLFEERLGLETTVVPPTGAAAKAALLPPAETLALAVTQSGRSTNTLAAVAALRGMGFAVTALTADAASPVARAADAHVPVACGEEDVGPKTKGVTATVLTLYLLGMHLAKARGTLDAAGFDALCAMLETSCSLAEENIRRSKAFCGAHLSTLAAQPHFTAIADGPGHPVAAEGALKVLETLYVPAFAYEFEEYLHGVNNTIAPGQCNLLAPTCKENLARMQALDAYGAAKGCVNFTVTTLAVEDAPRTLRLLGSGSPYAAPFEGMLFFQVLSALGSEHKGIDCDSPKFADFYDALGTKARG